MAPDERLEHHLPGHGESFAQLLRDFRNQRQLSRNEVAHRAGVNPSYLTRLESGERKPGSLDLVEAVAQAMKLHPTDVDRLHVAAGYVPPALQYLGGWDPTVGAVAEVLSDPDLTDGDLQRYRAILGALCQQYLLTAASRRPRQLVLAEAPAVPLPRPEREPDGYPRHITPGVN